MPHTAGLWVHYDDSQDGKTNRHEVVTMGKTICHIYHSVPEEDAANAQLIAAAPTMLAALKIITEPYEGFSDEELRRRGRLLMRTSEMESIIMARAAIGLATLEVTP